MKQLGPELVTLLSPSASEQSLLFTELDAAVRETEATSQGLVTLWKLYIAAVLVALPTALLAHAVWMNLFTCVTVAFLFVTYAFNIFHMRLHMGHLFGWKSVDAFLDPILTFIDNSFMVTPSVWIQNHQGSHHLYTNHTKDDRDLVNPYSILRLHEDYEWRWFHAFQPYYTPFVLALNVPSFPWENYFVNRSSFVFFFTHFFSFLVLPCLIQGHVWPVLFWYCILVLITSFIISLFFQISHNSHSTVMQCPYTHSTTPVTFNQWIQQQASETISWGGFLPTLLVGGINLQVEHHVAPALCPILLSRFQPRLAAILKKHNIVYTEYSNLFTAIAKYWAHLRHLSRPPSAPHKHSAIE